jgi:predicted ATPase
LTGVDAKDGSGRLRSRGLSPVIGRDEDIAMLVQRLALGARLVSLVGPPGVGKTRLACAVAERQESWPSLLVDAARASDAESLAVHLLDALRPTRDATANLRLEDVAASALVEAGDVLVVLDNAEHLLEPVAEVVAAWLRRAPGVRILVTSRVRLRVAEESVFVVEPLCVEDGVELFLARAPAGRERFGTPAVLRSVEELVRRLDRIPLAIELAAARSNVLKPGDLLQRLSERLDLLRGGRDAPSRHATLRVALRGSWELLTESEQRALALTSVFSSSFSLAAAEAVLASSVGAPTEALAALADASLLRVVEAAGFEDEARFAHYEIVRELAVEQLAAHGPELGRAARRRYAEHFALVGEHLAEAARGDDGIVAMSRLALESDHLNAAFEAHVELDPLLAARNLLALAPLVSSRGPFATMEQRIARCVAALQGSEQGPIVRARLLALQGVLQFHQMRFSEAVQSAVEAASIAGQHGAHDVAAEARTTVFLALQWQGQAAPEQLEPDAPPVDSPALCFARAVLVLHRGQMERAGEICERGIAEARRRGERREEGRLHAVLAVSQHELCRFSRAEASFDRAEELLARSGDEHFLAITGLWRGLLECDQGAVEDAVARLTRARERLVMVGDAFFVAAVDAYRGLMLHASGLLTDAKSCLERALGSLRADRDAYRLGVFLPAYACLLLELGDRTSAQALMTEAEPFVKVPVNRFVGGVFELALGCFDVDDALACARTGDTAGRERALARARARLARVQAPTRDDDGSELPALWQVSSDVRFAGRRLERALAPLEASAEVLREDAVCVAEDGSFFETPEGGRVELGSRPTLARLLAHLMLRHRQAPDTEVATTELVDAGWPGERILAAAAVHRVHVAISTLRRLGLSRCLLRRRNGYAVVGAVRIVMPDQPYARQP